MLGKNLNINPIDHQNSWTCESPSALAEVQFGKSPGRCGRCGCSKNLKVLKGEDLDDIYIYIIVYLYIIIYIYDHLPNHCLENHQLQLLHKDAAWL